MPENIQVSIEDTHLSPINTVDLRSPNIPGTIRLIYGIHALQTSPSKMSPTCDGMFLELSGYNVSDPAESLNEYFELNPQLPEPAEQVKDTLESVMGGKQYEQIGRYVENHNIPVYLPDVAFKDPGLVILGESSYTYGQLVVGAYLLQSLPGRVKQHYSRREFLQLGLDVLKLGLGGWLMSPAVSGLLRAVSAATEVGTEQTKSLLQASNAVHPESTFLTITMRNTILAEKIHFLMREKNIYDANLIIGSNHVAEHPFLASSEDRNTFLEQCRTLGLLRCFKEEGFYTVPELKYNGTSWAKSDEVTVPSLKALFQS